MSKYLETKKGSLESAVLEAVSAAQQAAIAIAKKEKEQEEELSAKQKKLDVDKDGDIGADDLAALRKKAKKEEKDMSGMCCKHCGDEFGKPTAESSCTYDAYDPMGENWVKKESVKEEYSLAERAAKHITDLWKEAAKVKEADEKREKTEEDGKTMTGKPMSKVKVAPAEAEKEV